MNDLDYDSEPKQVKRRPEPRSVYDFCKIFSSVTGLPVGKFLKDTRGWPITWFIEVQSLCKEKGREQQAKIINWYVKSARTKEI